MVQRLISRCLQYFIRALNKGVFSDNKGYFLLVLNKNICCDPLLNRLYEMDLMRGHNIWF